MWDHLPGVLHHPDIAPLLALPSASHCPSEALGFVEGIQTCQDLCHHQQGLGLLEEDKLPIHGVNSVEQLELSASKEEQSKFPTPHMTVLTTSSIRIWGIPVLYWVPSLSLGGLFLLLSLRLLCQLT